jgi:hypothetical protein
VSSWLNLAAEISRVQRAADWSRGWQAVAARVDLAACFYRQGGDAPAAWIDLTPLPHPPSCNEAPGEAEDTRDSGDPRRLGAPMPGSGGSPGGDQEEEGGEDDDAAGRDMAHGGSLESAPARPP